MRTVKEMIVNNQKVRFCFYRDGDLTFPLDEIVLDRARVKVVAMRFWSVGFEYGPSDWARYAP